MRNFILIILLMFCSTSFNSKPVIKKEYVYEKDRTSVYKIRYNRIKVDMSKKANEVIQTQYKIIELIDEKNN